MPIIDAAFATVYNDTDVYEAYTRGKELDIWLKNPDGGEYRGRVWPGVTVFPDWSAPNIDQFWYECFNNFSLLIGSTHAWLDMVGDEDSRARVALIDLANSVFFCLVIE